MNKLLEELLKKRRIKSDFLNPVYEKLGDPFLLSDMKGAVERLKLAKKNQEKVLIFGDYDVDGVTASIVMHDALKLAGIENVEVVLPDRFRDGYGLSERAVQVATEGKYDLVVTVDCGSSNGKIVDELNEKGIDVIVTDHHEMSEVAPRAVAVVNPKRDGKYEELAGVGVAFMVARAMVMEGMIPEGQEKWMLDLVVLGTICDDMKMTGENRILTFFGMKVIDKTRRQGLKELIRISGAKVVNGESIGFQLGPRLNAAGRMKSADLALELLMEKNRAKAASRAKELNELNEMRRKQQMDAVTLVKNKGVPKERVIVEYGGWHEGIIGIIAGRLCEDYRRPAFVFSLMEDGETYKGSGRSFGDFSLKNALEYCKDEIVSGGGHAGACGVKVKKENIGRFKKAINEYYESLGLKNQEKYFEREADVLTSELDWFDEELFLGVQRLEPFGEGNPEPVFRLTEVRVIDKKLMGKGGEHLMLLVKGEDEKLFKTMAFYAPERWMEVETGDVVTMDITMAINEWNGKRNVEGRIAKITLV